MAPAGVNSHAFPTIPGRDIGSFGRLPGLNNRVQDADQMLSLTYQKGIWSIDKHRGELDATIINSRSNGSRVIPLGSEPRSGDGAGGGAEIGNILRDELAELLKYEYCRDDTLFYDHFSETLFKAPVFVGSVGPVEFEVWGKLLMELHLALRSQLELLARGLPAPGEHAFESHFWLHPELVLMLAAAAELDILFGIVSVEVGLNFDFEFDMLTHFGMTDSGVVGPEAKFVFGMLLEFFWEGVRGNLASSALCGETSTRSFTISKMAKRCQKSCWIRIPV